MMVLITGGSKCGKSTLAERLALRLAGGAPVHYLATMQVVDAEDRQVVRRHQWARAGKGFEVLEQARGLDALREPDDAVLLLEDVPNLLANEMFGGAGADAALRGVLQLHHLCRHLVVVTNEVGSDGLRYPPETQGYIDALGRLNQQLAAKADTVVESVCGLPHLLKGALPCDC